MPDRFIFRMTQYQDCARFFADGELRSKNHPQAQACHQASYGEIVSRRNTKAILTPDGKVINDHVAFYFSPMTSMAFTISKGNVQLVDPEGKYVCQATMDDRVFFVGNVKNFAGAGLPMWFSDIACNSLAPSPSFENDIGKIEQHVDWSVFDDGAIVARINEIGYGGVTHWFHNKDEPPRYANRSQKRMAEFLVRDAVPLNLFDCIVVKSDSIKAKVEGMMVGTGVALPVYTKTGCFF